MVLLTFGECLADYSQVTGAAVGTSTITTVSTSASGVVTLSQQAYSDNACTTEAPPFPPVPFNSCIVSGSTAFAYALPGYSNPLNTQPQTLAGSLGFTTIDSCISGSPTTTFIGQVVPTKCAAYGSGGSSQISSADAAGYTLAVYTDSATCGTSPSYTTISYASTPCTLNGGSGSSDNSQLIAKPATSVGTGSASPVPTAFTTRVYYKDAACTTPTGYSYMTAYGECVATTSGGYYITSVSLQGTALTLSTQAYQDASCTVTSGNAQTETLTANSCRQGGTGRSTLYSMLTVSGTQPILYGWVQYNFQSYALCSGRAAAAATLAYATVPGKCVPLSDSTSEILTVTGTGTAATASTQQYSDAVCSVAQGSPDSASATTCASYYPLGYVDDTQAFQSVGLLVAPTAGPTAPTGWALQTFYTDSACANPTGHSALQALGECVQTLSNGVATGKSQLVRGSLSGSSVPYTVQFYSDAACTYPVGSLGSGATPTGCSPAGTDSSASGTSTLYQRFTYSATQPALTGAVVVYGYQAPGSKCTGSTISGSATSGVAFSFMNTCTQVGNAMWQKVTLSGSALSVASYSDAACSTAAASPGPYVLGTTGCSAAPAALLSTLSDNTNAYLYASVPLTSSSSAAATTYASSSSCFAGSETVQLQDGSLKALSDLRLGDAVLTAGLDGALKGFSPVVALPHAGETQTAATFVQLFTADKDVKMTPDHLVLAGSCAASAPLALVQARTIKTGDCLQTSQGRAAVTAVKTVQGRGIASAVTQAGDLIVVNGIVASPFAVSHRIGEAWYVIHRALHAVLPSALGWRLFQQTSEKFGDLAVLFSA